MDQIRNHFCERIIFDRLIRLPFASHHLCCVLAKVKLTRMKLMKRSHGSNMLVWNKNNVHTHTMFFFPRSMMIPTLPTHDVVGFGKYPSRTFSGRLCYTLNREALDSIWPLSKSDLPMSSFPASLYKASL